jgi:hypothetical protein
VSADRAEDRFPPGRVVHRLAVELGVDPEGSWRRVEELHERFPDLTVYTTMRRPGLLEFFVVEPAEEDR